MSPLLGGGVSPPNLRLFFAEVLGELSLDLVASKLRHLFGALDRADAVSPGAGEDDVHLLKAPAFGLGEEEVDSGDQSGVQDSEDDVGSPGQVGERRRSDHDDDKL